MNIVEERSRMSHEGKALQIAARRRSFMNWLRDPDAVEMPIRTAVLAITFGALPYGLVLGLWRSPLQAIYSGLKLPILLFSVALVSALLNTMLAQIMGARLPLRRVFAAVLSGMAVTAVLLASLAPVALFFTWQAPAPPEGLAGLATGDPLVQPWMRVFRVLLLLHVGIIGFAGILGNLRIFRILCRALSARSLAARVLAVWIGVIGFAGCELSWLLSPFLCKPNFAPHLLARSYFDGNFYEHVYQALRELTLHP
jgi:hypothetical protein